MSQSSAPHAGHFHAVQFYNDAQSLTTLVAAFLAEGMVKGDAGVVIATPEHRVHIEAALQAHGLDIDRMKRLGQFIVLDARETLDAFMVDGMPNSQTFSHVVGRVLDQACQSQPNCTIRAYGEMVNVLWKDGFEAAAIKLETLWNQLANSRDFKLLSGYSMGNFYKGAAIEEIKNQHTHQVEEAAVPTVIN